MMDTYQSLGVSPGRGGYDLAMMASDLVMDVREHLCRFFGSDDPERAIFASNASDALNLIIQGMIEPGCHVVSSRLEHNSVLRPLHTLEAERRLSLSTLPFSDGRVTLQEIKKAIRSDTRLVVMTHGSNVLGSLQNIRPVAEYCASNDIFLIVTGPRLPGRFP